MTGKINGVYLAEDYESFIIELDDEYFLFNIATIKNYGKKINM